MPHIQTFLSLIAGHPLPAYVAVFVIAMTESLALVGILVPGAVLMFGIGAIVATGTLQLTPVMVMAGLGAVAGDGLSYWLGHRYRESLRHIWPFSMYPEMLNKGEVFFQRHGKKSILFGRFVGPVRPVIPLVAGMMGMQPLTFTVVNVLSAIGWAFAYILPGVFFGASLAVAGAVSARLVVLMLIVAGAVWGAVWVSRRLISAVLRNGPLWFAAFKAWATADQSGPRSLMPIKRFLAELFLRRQGEELFLGFLVLVLCAACWGFLGILQDVLAKDPLVLADQAVYHFFQSLRTPWADQIMVGVTELGDSFVNLSLFGAGCAVLISKGRYRSAGYWALAVLGGYGGVYTLKWMMGISRPVLLYQGVSAYAFPSGHTAMSVVVYGFLAVILAGGLSATARWTSCAAVLGVSFLIAISRLYLGAHWLSDVLGGFCIGAAWTALLGIMYVKKKAPPVPRRLLGLVLILVLAGAGGWHMTRSHARDLALYAPRSTVRTMSLQTWVSSGWRTLPASRIDLAGELEHPLSIQWAGQVSDLSRMLKETGWRPPPPLTVKSVLSMLSPDTRVENLPVLPRLHDGRKDALRLIRRVQGQRWVLRLWPEDVRLEHSGYPVLTGAVEEQHRLHLSGLITAVLNTGNSDRPLKAVSRELRGRCKMKWVKRNMPPQTDDRGTKVNPKAEKVLLLWDPVTGHTSR